MLLDDDDPPPSDDAIGHLVEVASGLPNDVAATGILGGRYNRRTGQTVRVPDADLTGMVEVDWIGGGVLPLYRWSALRTIELRTDLFFGFDDLDVGLRLRRTGWRLVIDGAAWRQQRMSKGRLGMSPGDVRQASKSKPWRRYYSARNLVLIARDEGWRTVLVATSFGLVRAVKLTRSSRAGAWMTLRGTIDGVLGRTGRTVDPGY